MSEYKNISLEQIRIFTTPFPYISIYGYVFFFLDKIVVIVVVEQYSFRYNFIFTWKNFRFYCDN